ncbi:MAG: DNA primase [Syntrophaceae bacterium]|nr:MAG: DNA primase [Syntrophaceae bacterium]
MRFDDSKIEEIKSRVDIVELASEYLTLKKAGRNYLGLCPFHQEKTPSFTVNREKQIFYCFGCGEGGNVITLLMKIANKSFPEAIKHLAEKTGVILPVRTFGREGQEKDSLHDEIINLNLRAAQQFSRNLSSPAGKIARDYLLKRAVTNETIKQFRLGYVPDTWRSLTDYIEGSGLSLKLAEQAGLIIAGKEGGFYDRFRGRLIFPIENVFGEIVAFGGRILGEGDPKYLNSPESPVYIKGKNLYGLQKAKEAIRQSGFCLIVEGYFDAISLWNAGVRNVVATLGTALTRDHLELLRRYTQDAVALFDPDTAGRRALDRSLELFLGANMRARALILPEGCDPDDYVKKYGKDKIEELIAIAPSISDYYIDNVLGDSKTFEESRDLVKTAMEFVNKINDEIEKNLFIKRIAEKLGIDQALLKREVHRKEVHIKSKSVSPKQDVKIIMNPLELNLIRLLLEYPQKAIQVEDEEILNYFMESELKTLGKKIVQAYKLLGYIDINVILSADEEKALRNNIYELRINAPTTDDNMVDRNFSDNIRGIKKKWYKEQHRQLKLKLAQAQENGNAELLQKYVYEKQNLMAQEKELR